MTLNVGDTIPNITFFVLSEDGGPQAITTNELFKGKSVAMFGVIGAFTSTCSDSHLPGFIKNADTFRERGLDDIICLSVNDAFVMAAWGVDQNVENKIRMISDGSANFVIQSGLELDLTDFGMGVRSQRFSMIIDDCVIRILQRENPPTADVPAADLTSAENLIDIMLSV
jgi:peroxiredoxin